MSAVRWCVVGKGTTESSLDALGTWQAERAFCQTSLLYDVGCLLIAIYLPVRPLLNPCFGPIIFLFLGSAGGR
jgi:hypothetical protein